MNYEEIIEKLKEHNEDVRESAYGDFPEELGETEEVFSKGGEGEGEDWRRVYHFKDHGIYIEFSGHYTSYHGTDFDDGWGCANQVEPVEKTITVYE